jgi:uncharacterized YccA/Bax inhibitor family protein
MSKFMSGLLTSLFVFISPVIPLILLVLVFVLFDTIIGMICSYKQGCQLQSRKLSRIVTKITIYVLMLLLVYGLDVMILSTWIETHMLVTKIGAGILCFIEAFSIDENIRRCNKDKGVGYYFNKIFDLIKKVKTKYNDTVNGKEE